MANEPFQLKKIIQGGRFVFDQALNQWDLDPAYPSLNSNWERTAGHSFVSQETIDIAGLSKQELTLFFGGQGLQRPNPYTTDMLVTPTGGAGVIDVFIVSDVPLGDATSAAHTSTYAGFNQSTDDALNTKFAQGKVMVQSTSAPITMIESDTWNFGSGDPTASDRLYLYRWLLFTSAAGIAINGNFIFIPDLRYIANGITTKEPELQHINRLRLSYEQQQRS
jgi:hypothetical protein